jgi:protein gp37
MRSTGQPRLSAVPAEVSVKSVPSVTNKVSGFALVDLEWGYTGHEQTKELLALQASLWLHTEELACRTISLSLR